MSLPLHPDHLVAVYDMLSAMPPFDKWKLPHSDEVMFIVCRSKANRGDYHWNGERHVIRVSSLYNKRLQALVEVMAHEMIHLHEEEAGLSRPGVQHSTTFQKLAKRVCKIHGFDEATF